MKEVGESEIEKCKNDALNSAAKYVANLLQVCHVYVFNMNIIVVESNIKNVSIRCIFCARTVESPSLKGDTGFVEEVKFKTAGP